MPTQNEFFPRIESITDSFGNTFASEDGIEESRTTVVDKPIVHPGDEVVFTCVGADSSGRQLEFTLRSPGGEPQGVRVAPGETATLSWTVREEDVNLASSVRIVLKAVGATYHRYGTPGDQEVDLAYRVYPPGVD